MRSSESKGRLRGTEGVESTYLLCSCHVLSERRFVRSLLTNFASALELPLLMLMKNKRSKRQSTMEKIVKGREREG